MPKVIIVGAGIMGMSTAYHLKKTMPWLDVSVHAKDFTPNLTSDGAAGLWEPFIPGGTPQKLIEKWSKCTFDYILQKIKTEKDSGKIGLMTCQGYNISLEKPFKLPFWADIPLDYHVISDADVAKRFPPWVKSAGGFTTVFIEGLKYLPFLMKEFADMGGEIFQKEIKSFGELYGCADVVVNCTGFGSKALLNDDEMYPVRGQIIKVKSDCLHEFCITGENTGVNRCTYILPNQDYVVLGGTEQKNNYNTEVSKEDREFILRTTSTIYPSIKDAEILEDWVGLRPCRSSMRVEKENLHVKTKTGDEKTMKVVHNYGHGGSGLTVHWGCALDTVKLIQEFLTTESSSKL